MVTQTKDNSFYIVKQSITNIFFQLLRYSIGAPEEFPSGLSPEMWNEMYKMAQQQSLLGVLFHGIQRQSQSQPPRNLLLKWYAISEQIRQRNVEMNKKCVELTEMLKKDGFESCILKGQGNAVMYPDPYVRMPGDIDVWVKPVDEVGERRKVVMEYVRKRFPDAMVRYQHIEFPVFEDVEVEVHFIPTTKNNPFYNHRIQRWAEERMAEQCRHFVVLPNMDKTDGMVCVPTVEFNIVYQLSHIMGHFFDEGVGLRQMMDYYYLLRRAKDDVKCKMENVEETLKYLGLWKFAGAVMWVLHEVLGLEEEYMIAPMDEWRGRLLLDEILKGGNFGKYSGLTNHSTGAKYFLKIKRNMRFVHAYPSEALCEPWFRTWHFFWRLVH